MDTESTEREWRALSEEILIGMKEWRRQHPKATLREIEEAVSERLSRLGARMIQDAAQTSAAADWTAQVEAPHCEHCGEVFVSRGNTPGTCRRAGERKCPSREDMAPAPAAALGFFPLDEELELLAGSLTPQQHESLARLCVHMPFARACQMLTEITGVQVSEATARRQTYVSGQAYEAVQAAQAQPAKRAKGRACPCQHCRKAAASGSKAQDPPAPTQAISSDGASVPLVGGEWAEVKTLAIGEVNLVETGQESRSRQAPSPTALG